jgi:hypothetical protein
MSCIAFGWAQFDATVIKTFAGVNSRHTRNFFNTASAGTVGNGVLTIASSAYLPTLRFRNPLLKSMQASRSGWPGLLMRERGGPPPDNDRSTDMSEPTVAEAVECIYGSLQADNADIDVHIATLKAALAREGVKEAVFDPARLVQNNRSGRKLMQAYFRQRGVTVKYSGS